MSKRPNQDETDMIHKLLDGFGVPKRLPMDSSNLTMYERVWQLSERIRILSDKIKAGESKASG